MLFANTHFPIQMRINSGGTLERDADAGIKEKNRLATVMAPPRRLELRSSAPEADTLSTELRGRAHELYHRVRRGQRAAQPRSKSSGVRERRLQDNCLSVLELFYAGSEGSQLAAQGGNNGCV